MSKFVKKNGSGERRLADALPRPKKSLGQHFLHNGEICTRIAALLNAEPEDYFLEIGPGPGCLTRALEKIPHKALFLLEKDKFWAKERQQSAERPLQSILMDALNFDWTRLNQGKSWKLIGNLPYNVASPLIWDILSRTCGLKRAVFMVQKEVAQRIAASPKSKDYGALTVWTQSFAKPRLEFCLAPGSFTPPPKVDSAILTFEPLPANMRPQNPEALAKVLKICFQQRRKQLAGIFRRAGLEHLLSELKALNLSPNLRPEELEPQVFQSLSLSLTGSKF